MNSQPALGGGCCILHGCMKARSIQIPNDSLSKEKDPILSLCQWFTAQFDLVL